MIGGAEFPEVHRGLVDAGVPREQAFTITMRVFRSGGLTKDAVYLRGLHELVTHLAAGGDARHPVARQDAARPRFPSSPTSTGAACSPIPC